MAGLFFDNVERQDRLKDLLGSFNDIREEITETIASVVSESAELKKALELLQGQGRVAAMEDLAAKVKEKMSDEEYEEYKKLNDELKDMDHDLWVAWSVMVWVDAGYAGVALAIELTQRYGAMMVGRGLTQAIAAEQAGLQIPASAGNLTARGVRAMRPRAGAFHIPPNSPKLAGVESWENFTKAIGKTERFVRAAGLVLLTVSLLLVGVDIAIQSVQRTDLMKAITDVFRARHLIKQLAMAIKSETRYVTDARLLLTERSSKEETLAGLQADGTITADKKDQLMASYDTKKKAEQDLKTHNGGISLPSNKDVYEELKTRDDLHNSWQKEDPDLNKLLEWLKEEAAKPEESEKSEKK